MTFAVLTQTNDKRAVLSQVAQMIETIPEKDIKSNIAACTDILAGLVLEKQIIVSIYGRKLCVNLSFIKIFYNKELSKESNKLL